MSSAVILLLDNEKLNGIYGIEFPGIFRLQAKQYFDNPTCALLNSSRCLRRQSCANILFCQFKTNDRMHTPGLSGTTMKPSGLRVFA